MGENGGSKVSYFIVGLGLGALVGILFAPKSGEETREFLVEKADEGSKYAQRKARELKERAEDLIEKSKEVAARQKESITAAVDAGREAYQREKAEKAKA
ncbi:MAG: YtxH domain-containing protein [Acidobacteria bacterium]|nr:MAG: YtxH domain-containing protein [Acidobacteriota bacterium]PYU32317.1 MAG: YtxH domain-containing protein [Acidobacteriota bacterium]